MARPAVFLDRDGTLNVEKNYLYRYQDWEWIPGAVEAIRLLRQAGYLAIVASNQAGIARGLYTQQDVDYLHRQVSAALAAQGAAVDAYYYCPHHPEYGERLVCGCRKPAPGLLLQAQRDWDIDLARSFVIGDRLRDLKAGWAAGVTSLLVATGYGAQDHGYAPSGTRYFPDVLGAAKWILANAPHPGTE